MPHNPNTAVEGSEPRFHSPTPIPPLYLPKSPSGKYEPCAHMCSAMKNGDNPIGKTVPKTPSLDSMKGIFKKNILSGLQTSKVGYPASGGTYQAAQWCGTTLSVTNGGQGCFAPGMNISLST